MAKEDNHDRPTMAEEPEPAETEESPPLAEESAEDDGGFFGADRIELIATIVLAAAVILTAWSAFEAGKWSGVQAINFSEAGANRTESTRFDTRAGQQAQVDIALFTDWVAALDSDLRAGVITVDTAAGYRPTLGTLSGFLFNRMRAEFRPALEAWLATEPIDNLDAPPTPFDMAEYQLEAAVEADRLEDAADQKALEAREANQHSDNYVLTVVLFASVLFFAGVSSKMKKRRNRILMITLGVILLLAGVIILSTFPIEI